MQIASQNRPLQNSDKAALSGEGWRFFRCFSEKILPDLDNAETAESTMEVAFRCFFRKAPLTFYSFAFQAANTSLAVLYFKSRLG